MDQCICDEIGYRIDQDDMQKLLEAENPAWSTYEAKLRASSTVNSILGVPTALGKS